MNRNCNNYYSKCNNITKFSKNNNKNIHCKSHYINNCLKNNNNFSDSISNETTKIVEENNSSNDSILSCNNKKQQLNLQQKMVIDNNDIEDNSNCIDDENGNMEHNVMCNNRFNNNNMKNNEMCKRNNIKCIKLTNVFLRYTSGYKTSTSISKHGKYVYLVYNITIDSSGNTVGEIFENKCGILVTKKIIQSNNEFKIVNGGYASDNFNKFSILDNNNVDIARIRIFDCKFNLLATRLFNNYYPNGNSFMGGKFICDGKYIVITYVYSYDNVNGLQKSILYILRSDTLEIAYEFEFEGNTYSYVKSFNIMDNCGNIKTHLILLTNDGIFNINKPEARKFSILKILVIDNCKNNIKLVDQVLLPQLANFDFIQRSNKILISVGTFRADIFKVKSIFLNSSKSLLLDDGNELRMYQFINGKLNIVYSKKMDTHIQVYFHPNQQFMLIHQNNIKTIAKQNNENDNLNVSISDSDNSIANIYNENVIYPGFFNINYLYIQKTGLNIGNSIFTQTAPNNFSAEFSSNGKWLIVTGSKESNLIADTYGIKNIQLFKIDV